MTLSGSTILGQSGYGSDGNEGVLCIPRNSNITEASLSDCLESYPGHSMDEWYPSAEMQSAHSAAPADWAIFYRSRAKSSKVISLFAFF